MMIGVMGLACDKAATQEAGFKIASNMEAIHYSVSERVIMDREEFFRFRKIIGKTQKQMAQLLATSLKAIHSYEQGWRTIPAHVERQMFFLMSRKLKDPALKKSCWTVKKCPEKRKRACPAWEFKTGDPCWFINGTICDGTVHPTWKQKMDVCRSCQVFETLMAAISKEDRSRNPSE